VISTRLPLVERLLVLLVTLAIVSLQRDVPARCVACRCPPETRFRGPLVARGMSQIASPTKTSAESAAAATRESSPDRARDREPEGYRSTQAGRPPFVKRKALQHELPFGVGLRSSDV
jgi:hypothetical protein